MLEVTGLTVGIDGSSGPLLRDLSFNVRRGEIVGLVGESGSGKTMASLALMGMLPFAATHMAGSIRLDGKELETRDEGGLAMIFQDPRASLNPTMRVGKQIARPLRIHRGLSKRAAYEEAVTWLDRVHVPGARGVARAYPHQLSGGMCQRVMIAMALACNPSILIADEPTTALDVTIQAQIFELIRSLVAETAGVLFITHDLPAVAEMCDRVIVLYGGQIMEVGETASVFGKPAHPYTQYLLDAITRNPDPNVIEPEVDFSLRGCRFFNRCPYRMDICTEVPPEYEVGPEWRSACFLHDEVTHAAP